MANDLTPWEKKMKARYETTDINKILKIRLAKTGGNYKVKAGENLFSIAQELTGDQRFAYELARSNMTFNVSPGDYLRIPGYRRNINVTKAAELAAMGQSPFSTQGTTPGYTPPQAAQKPGPLYGDIPTGASSLTPGGVLQEDVFWTQRGSTPQGQSTAANTMMQGLPQSVQTSLQQHQQFSTQPEGQLAAGMGMNTAADPRRGRGYGQSIQPNIPQVNAPFQGLQGLFQPQQPQQPAEQQAPVFAPYAGRITEMRAAQALAASPESNELKYSFALGIMPDVVRDSTLSASMAGIPKDFQAAAMVEAGYVYDNGVWVRSTQPADQAAVSSDNYWKTLFPNGYGRDVPTIQLNSGSSVPNTNVSSVPLNPYYSAASLNWRVSTG